MKTLFSKKELETRLSLPCVYTKNTVIFYEGEAVEKVALIIEGEVILKHYTLDGETLILSKIQKDAFFGDYLIHHPEPFYPGNIETTKETIIRYIDKDNLDQLLVTNKIFREYYLKHLSMKAITMNAHNKILSQKTIKAKLLLYLEQMVHQHNSLILEVPSKTQLAQYLNVARPSLHRTLKHLESSGVLELKQNTIILKNAICML